MAIALTSVDGHFDAGGVLIVTGTVTFSSNYATGGEDLSSVFLDDSIKSATKPLFLTINNKGGYFFDYDRTNNKLLCYDNIATEEGAGAYNAAVTTGTARFMGIFPKFH